MYEKPMLQRFGTFRDLTQSGATSTADAAGVRSAPQTSRS